MLNWEDLNVQEALKIFGEDLDLEAQKQALIDAFTAYNNNQANTLQLEAVLIANGEIKVEEDGSITIDGEKYPSLNNRAA